MKQIRLDVELKRTISSSLNLDVERGLQFQRAVIKRSLYHSEQYTRVRVRNSYTVCYRDGGDKYGFIRFFLSVKDHTIAVISPLHVCNHYSHPTELSDLNTIIVPVERQSGLVVVSVENIVCKCIFIDTGHLYVVKFMQCLRVD